MKYQNALVQNLDPRVQEVVRSHFDKEALRVTKGVFFTGGTGVGKTYALHAIQKRINELAGYNSCTGIENWTELLFELKEKISANQIRDFLSNHVTNRNHIFIDDVGAEKQTEWSQEMLYMIVNRAYEQCHALFIVTNLTVEQFTEKYGERITSRLVEMCEVVELTGEDRRI